MALRQFSREPEKHSVDREIYVLGKPADETPAFAEAGTALELDGITIIERADGLEDLGHLPVFLDGLGRERSSLGSLDEE